jgi:hypothetical protein
LLFMDPIDVLFGLNQSGPDQKESPFSRLIRTGIATEELLIRAYEQLHQYGMPYVCCFTQLPFQLRVDDAVYTVPALTEGLSVDLFFNSDVLEMDGGGQWTRQSASHRKLRTVTFTQVLAFVPLRDTHGIRYYRRYAAAVLTGATDEFINPDLHRTHESRKRTPHMWDSKIAADLRNDFQHALGFFLHSYRMLANEYLPPLDWLYGYFCLFFPGCIAYGNPPVPIQASFVPAVHAASQSECIDQSRLTRALQMRVPHRSRFLDHLLAMQRIAREGEPELALIGAVMAIETHLSMFVEWRRPDHRPSIADALRQQPCSGLPEDLRLELVTLARTRNSLVHGDLPNRIGSRQPQRIGIAEALRSGVQLYRETYARNWRPLRNRD